MTATIGCLGVLEEGVEDLQFLLDEEADPTMLGRELLGDGDHRGLVAVAGSEGVVDVGVGQAGELPGEGSVALLLSLVEPDVLEDQDLARLKRGGGGLSFGTDGVVRLLDRLAEQFSEPDRDLVELERGIVRRVTGWPTQVADQDQRGPLLQGMGQRRQRGADSTVVGDLAILGLGDVEVDPDQDFATSEAEVADRLLGQCGGPSGESDATGGPGAKPSAPGRWARRAVDQPRWATLVINSAVRFE